MLFHFKFEGVNYTNNLIDDCSSFDLTSSTAFST